VGNPLCAPPPSPVSDPDATELTHLPKNDTKRQKVGDFAQDICLISGHQEEAATSPWHHFASQACKGGLKCATKQLSPN